MKIQISKKQGVIIKCIKEHIYMNILAAIK